MVSGWLVTPLVVCLATDQPYNIYSNVIKNFVKYLAVVEKTFRLFLSKGLTIKDENKLFFKT